MNLRVCYCNHTTADLSVREKLAFASEEQVQRALQSLKEDRPALELAILSTCNRVEIYVAESPESNAGGPSNVLTLAEVVQFLSSFHQIPVEEFAHEMREESGRDVVRHLFEVTSSLDSLVLGEPQIVNQVKEAYRLASENDACGSMMHALFQGAIRASNRVRTETRLSLGHVSIASVAVGDFAKSIFDTFHDKQVLVIGAGEMALETLRYLKDEGVSQIVIANRHWERAEKLSREWGGTPVAWEDLDAWLGRADVIVSTTGSDRPIIDRQRMKQARRNQEKPRPVFVLDLGAPRDFAPNVAELDDVFLYDIDSLQRTCEANRRKRRTELDQAQRIIEDETNRFLAEQNHRVGRQIVVQLREGWHDISRQELQRLFQKQPDLSAETRDDIERMVQRLVNKLLHPPLEVLRDEAREGSPHSLLDALRRLFRLPQ